MTEEIKEHLKYDPETGNFTWIKSRQGVNSSLIAGHVDVEGYVKIGFNKKSYFAHRLAWFFHYGVAPIKSLDHINGNRKDNRIINLREVTIRENQQNRPEHRNGKLVGFSFRKEMGKYRAKIVVKKKNLYLGYYDTELEAHQAYLEARKHHCGY